MKHYWKSAAAALMLIAVVSLTPRRRILCEGFLPPNNMKIPVGDVRALGIDEVNFNKTLDRVQEVYGPIIAAHGAHLVINRNWDDPTVNAYAEQNGTEWNINMFGGLARHRAVTPDGFALVACHELGHHLGGFPLIGGGGWASNEGQADYFGVAKCLRKVLGAKTPENLDPTAKAACAKQWPAGAGRQHCEEGAMAGLALADLLGELGGTGTPTILTPDPSQVAQTDDEHPAAQCRLDTYYQGSLCTKSDNEDFSRTDENGGACTASQGFTVGQRPRCWFKPAAGVADVALAQLQAPHAVINAKTVELRLKALRAALGSGK